MPPSLVAFPSALPFPPTPPPAGAAHIVGQLEAAHIRDVLTKRVLPVYLSGGKKFFYFGGGVVCMEPRTSLRTCHLGPLTPTAALLGPFPNGLGGTQVPLCPVALVSLRELVRGPV